MNASKYGMRYDIGSVSNSSMSQEGDRLLDNYENVRCYTLQNNNSGDPKFKENKSPLNTEENGKSFRRAMVYQVNIDPSNNIFYTSKAGDGAGYNK